MPKTKRGRPRLEDTMPFAVPKFRTVPKFYGPAETGRLRSLTKGLTAKTLSLMTRDRLTDLEARTAIYLARLERSMPTIWPVRMTDALRTVLSDRREVETFYAYIRRAMRRRFPALKPVGLGMVFEWRIRKRVGRPRKLAGTDAKAVIIAEELRKGRPLSEIGDRFLDREPQRDRWESVAASAAANGLEKAGKKAELILARLQARAKMEIYRESQRLRRAALRPSKASVDLRKRAVVYMKTHGVTFREALLTVAE